MTRPLTYVASRASIPDRVKMWHDFRDRGAQITSKWIDQAGPGETPSYSLLWNNIAREIHSSEQLVLYVEAGDVPLKGAYVECGMALALGLPVFVVTDFSLSESKAGERVIGSWIWHPQVRVFSHSSWIYRRSFMLESVFGLHRTLR